MDYTAAIVSFAECNYFELFEKLRDSKSNYYDNDILPAEYTPWAARDLDRFESMKIEKIGGR